MALPGLSVVGDKWVVVFSKPTISRVDENLLIDSATGSNQCDWPPHLLAALGHSRTQ